MANTMLRGQVHPEFSFKFNCQYSHRYCTVHRLQISVQFYKRAYYYAHAYHIILYDLPSQISFSPFLKYHHATLVALPVIIFVIWLASSFVILGNRSSSYYQFFPLFFSTFFISNVRGRHLTLVERDWISFRATIFSTFSNSSSRGRHLTLIERD